MTYETFFCPSLVSYVRETRTIAILDGKQVRESRFYKAIILRVGASPTSGPALDVRHVLKITPFDPCLSVCPSVCLSVCRKGAETCRRFLAKRVHVDERCQSTRNCTVNTCHQVSR